MKVNGYKIKPKADLSWADLSGTDLAGAKLGRANLKGANLEGANLSSAKLKGANLEGANLASANLRFADLEEADLTGADLTDAALCGANLSFAWLHRANLTRADLEEALLLTTRLTEANLTGAVLTGAVFQPTFDNFIVADETTVWPAGFDPEVAWASGAVIQTVEALAPPEKEVVEFTDDDEPLAVNAGFSKEGLAIMRDYIRDRNPPERLRRVDLVAQFLMEDTELDQGEDELTGIKYHLSTEGGVEDLAMFYAPALIWAFSELEEGRYEFARFFPDRSLNLQEPELADYFRWMRGESTEGDVWGRAEERLVEFGISLEEREVRGYEIGPGADLSGADLSGADLSGADLSGADLRDSNLYKTNLAEGNLYRADLSGAQIQETNFVGANLTEANLTNVRPLPENDSDHRSGMDTPAAAARIGANLAGANLAGANLAGANLAGANFDEANLHGANLAGANLYGANLGKADLAGANLTETHLNRTEVHGTNFTDTNLADADFMFLAFDGETVWPEGCPFGIPE